MLGDASQYFPEVGFRIEVVQFGRRSEKVQRQIEQLELRLEELEANKTAESTSPGYRRVSS